MKIELIYDPDCPNIEAARDLLSQAAKQCGIPAQWDEIDSSSLAAPSYASKFGSPTILVNGEDVAGAGNTSDANCCRVYPTSRGTFQGVPPVEQVVAALSSASAHRDSSYKGGLLSVVPVLGAVMIPGITCPACWPAYAAVLGSLGIGFFNYTPYILPVTAFLLVVALVVIGRTAKSQNFYLPLVLGFLASLFVVIGKFYLENQYLLWAGVATLISSVFWQSLNRNRCWASNKSCCRCSDTDIVSLKSIKETKNEYK